jgi:hypothetical protein
VFDAIIEVTERGLSRGAAVGGLVLQFDSDVFAAQLVLDVVEDVGNGVHHVGIDAVTKVFPSRAEFEVELVEEGTEHDGYDYFIHMRDASHPEREFVEWVDPQVGKQRDAELCQGYAFGISLDEWLSIEQDG